MAVTTPIGLGTIANDGTGDPIRTGGQTINANFLALDAANTQNVGDIADLVTRVEELETATGVKFFACILRNTGSGWYAIDDSNHTPYNIASVTNDTSKIVVTPSFTWDKIHSVVATPDETFASGGLQPGVRVTTSTVEVYLSQFRLETGYVYYDGAAWQSNGDHIVSTVWDGVNKLTITHGTMGSLGGNVNGAQVTAREDGYHPRVASIASGTTEVKFYDFSGTLITTEDTLMKFHFLRSAIGQTLNPNNVSLSLANIWVFGFCR